MTNQQGAPEALTVVAPTKAQIIEGLRAVQSSIGWRRPHILDQPECTHWDYIDAACAALVEAQQPAPSAAPTLLDWEPAHRIAYQAAAAFRPPYFDGSGFRAHNWVVEAIRTAHLDGQRFARDGSPPSDRSGALPAELRNRPKDADAQPVSARHPTVVKWRDNGIEACAKIAEAYGFHDPARDMRALLSTPQADSQPAPDPADIIAGALQISRGHAMELMQQAVDADRAASAPADSVTAPAGGVVGPDGMMRDELRSMIEGMSVSVDVSTGDHDAGHRYFGTVTEVMDCRDDKHGVTLLVQDAEPNFAPTPPAKAADSVTAPIDMVLHCPACGLQHIDAPDERTPDWKNEPHRSHLCHGCGHIWRPADVPTNGVKAVKTTGKADSPIAATTPPAQARETEGLRKDAEANKPTASEQKPIAYVDGDDAVRRILWEPNQAAFDIPVGTKLYAYPALSDAADAERYQWLRRWKGQEHEPPFTVRHEVDGTLWGGDLDAAIDAARKQGGA